MSDAAPKPWVKALRIKSTPWRVLVGLWGHGSYKADGPAFVWVNRGKLAEEIGLPLGTLRNGLDALAVLGWIVRDGAGWRLAWMTPGNFARPADGPTRPAGEPARPQADPARGESNPARPQADPRPARGPHNLYGTSNYPPTELGDDAHGREAQPQAHSGIAAVWCPSCGDCTCDRPDVGWSRGIDPACPLHGEASTHRDFKTDNPEEHTPHGTSQNPNPKVRVQRPEQSPDPSCWGLAAACRGAQQAAGGALSDGRAKPEPELTARLTQEYTPHGNADTQPHPQQNHAGACRGRERGRLGAQPQVPNVDLGAVPTGQPGDVRDLLPAHVEAIQARATGGHDPRGAGAGRLTPELDARNAAADRAELERLARVSASLRSPDSHDEAASAFEAAVAQVGPEWSSLLQSRPSWRQAMHRARMSENLAPEHGRRICETWTRDAEGGVSDGQPGKLDIWGKWPADAWRRKAAGLGSSKASKRGGMNAWSLDGGLAANS